MSLLSDLWNELKHLEYGIDLKMAKMPKTFKNHNHIKHEIKQIKKSINNACSLIEQPRGMARNE